MSSHKNISLSYVFKKDIYLSNKQRTMINMLPDIARGVTNIPEEWLIY